MIIPPDTEKDPRLFSESRASLSTDADLISLEEPAVPEVAYHRDFLYASPFTDEFAVYPNEALPPYDGQRAAPPVNTPSRPQSQQRTRARRSARNSDLLVRVTSAGSSSSLGSTATTSSRETVRAGPNGSAVPILYSDSLSSTVAGSSSLLKKEWDQPTTSSSKRRLKTSFSPELRRFWQKHRRWIVFLIISVVAAILVAIGLAVGLGVALQSKRAIQETENSFRNQEWPGSLPNAQVQIGTLNITYHEERDGPKPADGEPTECNNWQTLNTSSPLGQLALTSDFFDHYISTYRFPINDVNTSLVLANPFYFVAHGLAASGTVEIIGTEAHPSIKYGGEEGYLQVDILSRSPKDRPLDTVTRICRLKRTDGAQGLGIFTPTEANQGGPGAASWYLLDPLQTPAFHVIVRLPPSAMKANRTPTLHIPDATFFMAGMSAKIGRLLNAVTFGNLKIEADCSGGSISVDYISAQDILIAGTQGTVQGTFNVSSGLNITSTKGAILANVLLDGGNSTYDSNNTIDPSLPVYERRGKSDDDKWEDHHGQHDESNPPPPPPPPSNDTEQDWVHKDTWSSSNPIPSMSPTPSWEEDYTPATSSAEWSPQSSDGASNNTSAFNDTSNANNTDVIPVRNHTVDTTFVTNEGSISVTYLHHEPDTALRTFVASKSGMVDVAMHPNYVGPFALVNFWGSIRLPPSNWPLKGDPLNLGRTRTVLQGPIDVSNNTFYGDQSNRYTQTAANAPSSVTGAAFWSSEEYLCTSVLAAQYSNEGNGSAVYAIAYLGDLQITFDGIR